MIISMCEEVHQPSVQVPKAMVATIFINTFAGLLFLIPLVFVLPDIPDLLAIPSSQPVPTIIKNAVGSSAGAICLLVPIMVLAIICGIGCTTAASRCTWAFARDGAIPGSTWWRKVNQRLDLPLNAMMLSMVVQILLGLISFGSSAAFNAFSGVGVICLTAAYAAPIAISLASGRRHLQGSKFNLRGFGVFCNCVALGMRQSREHSACEQQSLLTELPAWSLLAMPLFCMPSSIPVTANTVNYAPVVFVGATFISAVWYMVWGHKNYAGPPTHEVYH